MLFVLDKFISVKYHNTMQTVESINQLYQARTDSLNAWYKIEVEKLNARQAKRDKFFRAVYLTTGIIPSIVLIVSAIYYAALVIIGLF